MIEVGIQAAIDNGLRVDLQQDRVHHLAASIESLASYLHASSDGEDLEAQFASKELKAIASRLVDKAYYVSALEVFVATKDLAFNAKCRPCVFRVLSSLMAVSIGWPDQPPADDLWKAAVCRRKLCEALDEAFSVVA